jgi:hypothetical protein
LSERQHKEAERRPAARRWWAWRPHSPRQWLAVAAGGLLVGLILFATVGLRALDEPLRVELERNMNQRLHGYHVTLGHAHTTLLGLKLTLRDLVVRQEANPDPPVANLPYLKASVQWRELLTFHLVGDVLFVGPRIHADLPQLRREAADHLSPSQRGWQQALESIFPLKFNSFRVREGQLVYVDADPQYPLEISHWMLEATNIRNIHSRDRTYPSPFHSEGWIFGTGRGTVSGNADFLAAPFPGVRAVYGLKNVPLDRLQPIGERSNLEIRGGTLTSNGEVEYAPRFRSVHIAAVRLEGVKIDYVHSDATAAAEKRRGEAVAAAAQQAASSSEVRIAFDEIHVINGNVGFVNRSTHPPYRMFLDQASLDLRNLSNRLAGASSQRPAVAELHGRFMATGSGSVKATFRPDSPQSDLGAEVAFENASLPALNDVLRAYQKIDVAAGSISVYSQLTIKNGQISGYVKPLFRDVQVYDPRQDHDKPLGTRVKEKVAGALAKVLQNRSSGQVATRTDLSGPVNGPHASTSEIVFGLLRNAYLKAILPGFESSTRQPRKAAG